MKITEDYVFFYGTGDIPSNFYPSPYCAHGYQFPTVEHGFQWEKACYFNDEETATRILETDCPAEAKRLGRLVKNFNEEEWRPVAITYMVAHVRHKIIQNPTIYRWVIEHAKYGRRFVEASKKDKIWGIGLYENEATKTDPCEWPGENRLGYCLDSISRSLMIENPWYQRNWAWFDKEEPTYVEEEDSNDNYFLPT